MLSAAHTWGTEAEERRLAFPCDRWIARPDAAMYRGITIQASREMVFRWLCQMRVAPYSYDWIDNSGRQSPRTLTAGLDQLAIGQDVMKIFELVDFVRDQHLTMRIKPGTGAFSRLGDLAVSYVIVPTDARSCRLLVKLIVDYPRSIRGSLLRVLLPWGDLIMMRRQLLNLRDVAEGTTKS